MGADLVPSRDPQSQGTTSALARSRRLDPFRVWSAHLSMMEDLLLFDGETFRLIAPLNMNPNVSANRPSNSPQPPPLQTFALPLDA